MINQVDPSDPSNPNNPMFTTPEQLAQQTAYAKALMEASTKGPYEGHSGNVTAVSPWGGIAQLTQALVGGNALSQIGPTQRALSHEAAEATLGAPVPGSPTGAPQGSGGPQASIDQYSQMIKARESGGNYGAIGQQITDPHSAYYGDRAYGAHQVMGKNIPSWTAEIGQPMSPEQFLRNPDAQEAVFRHKFGQYVAQTGSPQDAASMWFSGKPFSQGQYKQDQLGTTGAKYAGAFPTSDTQPSPQSPQGGQALAFNGPASQAPVMPPGSPQAMSAALSGGGQPSPAAPPQQGAPPQQVAGSVGGGALTTPPSPPGALPAGQPVPPGLMPQRQLMSHEQAMKILSLPPGMVPDNVRNWAFESYYGQNRPIESVNQYNQKVIANPNNPSQQMTITPIEPLTEEAAGAKTTTPTVTRAGPGGGLQREIIPNAGAGPPQGGTPQGAPQPPVQKPPDLIPPKASGKSSEAEPTEPAKNTKVAALETGTMSDAGPPGPLGTTPPPAKPEAVAGPGAPSEPQGAKTAQASQAPSPVSDRLKALSDFGINQEVKKDAAKEFNKKDIEGEFADLDGTQKAATNAASLLPQVKIARSLIENPSFTQGPGTDIKLAWTQLKSFLGDKGAQNELAYNQAFDKVISGNILSEMKGKLEGLGQVRLAEINLLKTAAASKYNTLAANRAILDMNEKYQDQLATLGKIATAYHDGYRWDDKGKLIGQVQGERPTKAGLNDALRTYLTNNPVYTDEQAKQYLKVFEDQEPPKVGAKPNAAPAPGGPLSPSNLPPGYTVKPAAPKIPD